MPKTKAPPGGYMVWITLLFVCITISIFILYKGSIQSLDTAKYIKWAKALIEHEFNLPTFFSNVSFSTPLILYTFPIVIFAILISVFNEQWIIAYQILNISAIFFTLFLYAKIALHLNIRKWMVSLSLLLFLVSSDYLLWPRYILTDTMFAALVMFGIYTVVIGTINRHNYFLLIILSSILLFFFRPSSPSIIAVFLFFGFLEHLSQRMLIKKTLLVRLGILTLLGSFLYSIVILASASGFIESKLIDFFYIWVEKGVIIHDRPETYITYEATFSGTVKLFFYRMIGFFTPFSSNFSLTHNALNGFLLLGCYIVILAMLPYSASDFEKSNNRAKAIALLLTLIVVIAISASVYLIDFDWRYRYPAIAPLILLATLILDNYLNSKEGTVGSD